VPLGELLASFELIESGKLKFFNNLVFELGNKYDWITNPENGYRYNAGLHWTQIPDYSQTAGDIKFTWEKSRFSYLYDIIRYDHHFGVDCSKLVLHDIVDWIEKNPVNQGPNYRCSQEMSVRILNWTFALHFYKNSAALTGEVFEKIQYALYWQIKHIEKNINFSRIAVRNNHALTETLALYLTGLLYPTLPGAATRKKKGKKWFEEEIAYQVYRDGTFLQFSMNYHRIVVQLLTWAIVLAEKNGERWHEIVYDRAGKSLDFLYNCMDQQSGWLSNYGNNDGALFFKLNDAHFRDYRPQLSALAAALGIKLKDVMASEDELWYGIQQESKTAIQQFLGNIAYSDGGYYLVRTFDSLTMVRCGSHRNRPFHADNLHLDLWYKGKNILIDAGSYKYNTETKYLRYFNGTRSHNTVMLGNHDQMLKGGHFTWYYWTQCLKAAQSETEEAYVFEGTISAFHQVNKGITHTRKIVRYKHEPKWIVTDEIRGNADPDLLMIQLWHTPSEPACMVSFSATDSNGNSIEQKEETGWESPLYGSKQQAREYYFCTAGRKITTIIQLKDN
jgi:hypothetical protein